MDSFLDVFDGAYFVESCNHTLDSIYVKDPVSEPVATLPLYKDRWQTKHDEEIDECQSVHRIADASHRVLFNLHQRL